MTNGRLTVITPSLNQAPFLERAIQSVIEQRWPDVEHIVIDGGSRDGTIEILRRYESHLAHWESEPDRGQSHALNKALARATGAVVAWLNSDDFYLPGAFAAGLAPFADPSVRWTVGTTRYETETGGLHALLEPRLPRGPRIQWVRGPWYVPQAASFWRRDVFREVGGFREDLTYVMDTEFGLRLALAGIIPRVVEGELAVRFLHGGAKSADSEHFDREWQRVERDLVRTLRPTERAAARLGSTQGGAAAARGVFVIRRRLGLLNLRERLGMPRR